MLAMATTRAVALLLVGVLLDTSAAISNQRLSEASAAQLAMQKPMRKYNWDPSDYAYAPFLEAYEIETQICENNTGHVLFFGDSDIAFWDTATSFPTLDSVNIGVPGARVLDMAVILPQVVEKCRPKGAVVFVGGENDMDHNETAEITFNALQMVLDEFWSAPDGPLPVIYISTRPEPASEENLPLFRQYDQMVREYAAAQPPDRRLVYIDSYTTFAAESKSQELWDDDGMHLSDAGYSLWTNWTTHALASLGLLPVPES